MVVAMNARLSPAIACIVALALLAAAAPALARDGHRREARVAGRCSKGAASELRLRARDGRIRVDFAVKRSRSRATWRIVLVQERRVKWRGTVRSRASRSFRVRRSLANLGGPDRVTVRAYGRRGITCEASATLPG
jgi:hypothetical protein